MSMRIFPIVGLVVWSFVCCLVTPAAGADFIWIEGEQPRSINMKPDINGSGRPQLLSDGKWLTIHLEPDEIGKQLPVGGADKLRVQSS